MVGGSSPARVGGKVYREVTINGKKYTLNQPQKAGIYADMEAFILSRRMDSAVFALRMCRMAPANMHAAIVEGAALAAQRGFATSDEWAAFENSPWKGAFLFFNSLDPKHRDEVPDVESALRLFESAQEEDANNAEEVAAKVQVVSQEDAIKNSSGPISGSGQVLNQSPESPSIPDGPQCTTDSLPNTDSPPPK